MDWLDRLKYFKKKAKESYKSISDKSGIAQTTIEKIFSGKTQDPGMLKMDLIAAAIGCSVNDIIGRELPLSRNELTIIHQLRSLDMRGTHRVQAALQSEIQRMEAESASKTQSVMFYDLPVSAGTGQYLDYTTAKIMQISAEPPIGTDFMLRISGDSMEPKYCDGDYVFVKKQNSVSFGEVGIFSAAGNVYIKVYEPAGLRSLNPAYKLIPGSKDICCLGKVLGVVKV